MGPPERLVGPAQRSALLRACARGGFAAFKTARTTGRSLLRASARSGLVVRKHARREARRLTSRARLAGRRLANALGFPLLQYRAPGELRACPACRGRRLAPLDVVWQRRADEGRFAGFMSGCRDCGLVFVNPLPSAEELAAYYAPDSSYVDERWRRAPAATVAGVRPSPAALRGTAGDEVARKVSQEAKLELLFGPLAGRLDVLRPPPGAKVLDYGCGPGRVLDRLQKKGWQTFGIEPALKSAFARHQELDVPPLEPTFHLVIVHHVLEHLRDPLDVLRAIAGSMVEGGILYASVPRFDALPRHGDLDYCINPHGHIVAYTADCLRALFAMAGLQAIEVAGSEDLDTVLTEGVPRRLRLFGEKVARPPAPPAVPLAAAEAALKAYRGRPGPGARSPGRLPVRLRAALAQRALTGAILAHRARRFR